MELIRGAHDLGVDLRRPSSFGSTSDPPARDGGAGPDDGVAARWPRVADPSRA